MKRRRFFQYAGFGGLSLTLAAGNKALASAFSQVIEQPDLRLDTFTFRTPTVDHKGRIKHQQTHIAQYFSESLNLVDPLEMVAIPPRYIAITKPDSCHVAAIATGISAAGTPSNAARIASVG